MRGGPPPLRFLALVVGGWVCIRAAMLAPAWHARVDNRDAAAAIAPVPRAAAVHSAAHRVLSMPDPAPSWASAMTRAGRPPPSAARAPDAAAPTGFADTETASGSDPLPEAVHRFAGVPASAGAPALPLSAPAGRRWSGAAWAFARRGGARQLAAGGLLGGSQIGGRLAYRLNRDPARPLALVARVYAPLGQADGAEAALGLEWQPATAIPVRLMAERRQAIGAAGRSAFSLLVHGGVSGRPLTGPVRIDAYGQAGMVGLHSRDLFADGSIQLAAPIDRAARLEAGGGLWAAAQPGLSRLDIGPHLSLRLPAFGVNTRLAADWRFRIAGEAAPMSGPALTLAADF